MKSSMSSITGRLMADDELKRERYPCPEEGDKLQQVYPEEKNIIGIQASCEMYTSIVERR